MGKNNPRSTNWKQLPHDILVQIFMSLNIIDLVAGVSVVCHSWREACFDPLLWREVDFNDVKSDLINIPREINAWADQVSSTKYLGILKSAFNLSRGSVTCLTFHYWVLLKDEHLLCVAQRTPNLKRLVLSPWNQLTVPGFEEAVKHWKDLESLTISCNHLPCVMMKSIGTHCRNFSELNFVSHLDLEFATAILTYIPKIKILNLKRSVFHKDALLHLINGLKHLEVLDISHAVQFEKFLDRNTWYGMNIIPDEEIEENGLRIAKFINCPDFPCSSCKHPLADAEIMFLLVWEMR